MDKVKVNCPQCGQLYTIADHLVGKKARCKKCGAIFSVVRPEQGKPRIEPPIAQGGIGSIQAQGLSTLETVTDLTADEINGDAAEEAAPAPPTWYCRIQGTETGPIVFADLKAMAAGGTLKRQDEVRRAGMGGFVAASTIEGLFPPAPPAQEKRPAQPKAEAVVEAHTPQVLRQIAVERHLENIDRTAKGLLVAGIAVGQRLRRLAWVAAGIPVVIVLGLLGWRAWSHVAQRSPLAGSPATYDGFVIVCKQLQARTGHGLSYAEYYRKMGALIDAYAAGHAPQPALNKRAGEVLAAAAQLRKAWVMSLNEDAVVVPADTAQIKKETEALNTAIREFLSEHREALLAGG